MIYPALILCFLLELHDIKPYMFLIICTLIQIHCCPLSVASLYVRQFCLQLIILWCLFGDMSWLVALGFQNWNQVAYVHVVSAEQPESRAYSLHFQYIVRGAYFVVILRMFLLSFSFYLRAVFLFTSIVRYKYQPYLLCTKYVSGLGLRGICTQSVGRGVFAEKFDLLCVIIS